MYTPKYPSDLTGLKFGKLTVIRKALDSECTESQRKLNMTKWVCSCECNPEKIFIVNRSNLTTGHTASCGCTRAGQKRPGNTSKSSGKMQIKHIWESMNARCYSTNHIHYKDYGGRGITICDEWLNNFESFYQWAISHGYNDRLTIDRIDNEKPYGPDNCHFVLNIDQQQNKRNTIKCDSGLSLRAECRIENVPYTSVRVKIKQGYSIPEAISLVKQDREKRGITSPKETIICDSGRSLYDECKYQNVPYTTVKFHINNGYSVNEAIEKVKNRVFISDLAKDAGINPGTVRKRIFDGKILDEALDTRDLHYPYYGGIKATDICDKYGLKYKKVARRMHYYNWTFKQALISFLKDEPEKIKEIEETVPETKD